MANILPALGSYGLFELDEPFNNALTPDVSYTCVALRQLDDIVRAGGNPKSSHYDPKGIPDAKYALDAAAGVCIVSLQDPSGAIVHVPSSYILKFPDSSGVPYTAMLLSLELGPIPDSLDLSWLSQRAKDLIRETIGITSVTAHAVAISNTILVNRDTHLGYEAARRLNITENQTDLAKYLKASTDLQAAQQRITELETYIKTNLAP